ncbi:MAG: aminotransferase, partial [Anaerolineae bacterium]
GGEWGFSFGSTYLDYLQWAGTDDVSAYLAVPAAIEFQETHNWTAVRQQCHLLLQDALDRVNGLTGIDSPYPNDAFYHQMAVAPLPPLSNLEAFKAHLYDEYRVEIPCHKWQAHQFIRISIQGYNSGKDIDVLLNALQQLLPVYQI